MKDEYGAKYIRGDEAIYNTAIEDLPKIKVLLVVDNEGGETPWAGQGDGYIVLLNNAVSFLPCRSWGAVFKSKYSDTEGSRETIDVTSMRGDSPDDLVLTLHPESYDSAMERGHIQ